MYIKPFGDKFDREMNELLQVEIEVSYILQQITISTIRSSLKFLVYKNKKKKLSYNFGSYICGLTRVLIMFPDFLLKF